MAMDNTSDNVLKFVKLRTPSERQEKLIPIDLELIELDNLIGLLVGAKRSDRHHLAQQNWKYDFITEITESQIYKKILGAINKTLNDEENPNIIKLLENLDLAGEELKEMFKLLPTMGRILILVYFSPENNRKQIYDIARVYRIITFYKTTYKTFRPEAIVEIDNSKLKKALELALKQFLEQEIVLPKQFEKSVINQYSVGIGDLLVVKQQIKRYEPGEIAHIENVMATETRDRTHRRLDRSEETFVTEYESEREKESELETNERYEVSNEVRQIVKSDRQMNFGMDVSGKYGRVEFSSNFDLQKNKSRENETNNSREYAKDVMERAIERVREKVRRKQTTKIMQEVEETNKHAFINKTENHIVGIYQYIDKVYEAQIFNYGKRELYDISIPEPASYLWHKTKKENEQNDESKKPVPPKPLNKRVIKILDRRSFGGLKKYEKLAVEYQASVIEPPPEKEIIVTACDRFPEETDSAAPGNYSTLLLDVNIPDDYKPVSAKVSAMAIAKCDNTVKKNHVTFNLFGKLITGFANTEYIKDLEDSETDLTSPGDSVSEDLLASTNDNIIIMESYRVNIADATDPVYYCMKSNEVIDLHDIEVVTDAESGAKVGVVAFCSKMYLAAVTITCKITEKAMQTWRLKTYDTLMSAYQDRYMEYQEELARYNREKQLKTQEDNIEREFGVPPSMKEEIIRKELKKFSIAMITEDFFEKNDNPDFPVMMENSDSSVPPNFHIENAMKRGSFVRFFEQAFEWEQMQFVFYPYYWAKVEKWNERFDEDDSAHLFRQFLQAGWARVVVPVRPGFNEALHYYILTGLIWKGDELPPNIGSAMYFSITDEIGSMTGKNMENAVPVGEPWDVRVPTSLVHLRSSSTLPKWEKEEVNQEDESTNHWNWAPVEEDSDKTTKPASRIRQKKKKFCWFF